MEKILYHLETFLKRHTSRRTFLKAGVSGFLFYLTHSIFLKNAFAKTTVSEGRPKKNIKGNYDLVVSEDNDPYKNTNAAVLAMGGMERFVKKGDIVVIKPNMAWDRTPEQAANTDPQVVACLTELCYKAGAKRVNIFDIPCNDDRRCYQESSIERHAREKGAYVYYADHWNVVKAHFKYKSGMEDWPILRDAVVSDTFINVPVLKHHRLTRLTLSMKNLMGVCSGRRGTIHFDIGKKLVDLTDFISPDLTVIDATRVLMRNGPSGGNLDDVVHMNKVIIGTDPALSDAYAANMVDVDPMSVPYIKEARDRGFGSTSLTSANIKSIKT